MIQIDMPMPENCAECPMIETVDQYSYRCVITKTDLGSWFQEWMPFLPVPRLEKRADDCPLIEIGEEDEKERGV